jgi:hypothetical protein
LAVLDRSGWQFSGGRGAQAFTMATWLLPSAADFSTPGPLGPCGVFGALSADSSLELRAGGIPPDPLARFKESHLPTYLSPEQLARDLDLRDLTDPSCGPHAVQLLVDIAAGALTTAWGCVQRRSPGERIVAIVDNYDNLAFTPDAAEDVPSSVELRWRPGDVQAATSSSSHGSVTAPAT